MFCCSYESKGKQWAKSQPKYPVGMSPAVIAAQEKAKQERNTTPIIPGLPPSQQATKKKKKTPKTTTATTEVTKKLAGFTIQEPVFGQPASSDATKPVKTEKPAASEPDNPVNTETEAASTQAAPATDPAKRLKNLRKKLKDIESLESRVKSGELKNPDKDQLEKIKRKKEVAKEIKQLEKVVN